MRLLFVTTGVFPGEDFPNHETCLGWCCFPTSAYWWFRSINPFWFGWDSDITGWPDCKESNYEGFTVNQTLWSRRQGLLQISVFEHQRCVSPLYLNKMCFFHVTSELGGAPFPHSGNHRWMANGAVTVALPGAHLLFRRHHEADSRRGTPFSNRG